MRKICKIYVLFLTVPIWIKVTVTATFQMRFANLFIMHPEASVTSQDRIIQYLEGIMRVLDKAEVNQVSGGTFGLIGGLLGLLFGSKSYCAPVQCAPVKCAPPKKGC